MKLTRSEAWEASFFGFPVEEIRIGNSLFADVTDEVSALIEGASPETLLKVSVDARQLHAIPWLERQGFELWESRHVWLTTFSRDELTQKHALHASLPEDRIVWGTEAHHEAILSMTQAQVAEALGISVDAISRMERGTISLNLPKLMQFAQLFKCKLSDFVIESSPIIDEQLQYLAKIIEPLDINQRNHLIKIIESMVIWYNGKDS